MQARTNASFIVITMSVTSDYKVPNETLNSRPIIGILSQEVSDYVNSIYDNKYHCYIAASYVKFIEGSGARVVPIWIGKKDEYYEDIMSKINGVLWPGGASYFTTKNGYADAAYKVYKIAERINNEGKYFPMLCICLGFELLTYVMAERQEHREKCDADAISLSLDFKPNYKDSKLYGNAPTEIIDMLREHEITSNFHKYCITEQGLNAVGLSDELRILSTSRDRNGKEFISSVESVKFPFYGLQFHPEKNIYEWIVGRKIPHDENAVKSSQYFANFIVNEARKNRNMFPNNDQEARSLIYNYPTTYTGVKKILFQQCYLFTASTTS